MKPKYSYLNSVNSIWNCWWAINYKSPLCFVVVEYRNLSGGHKHNYYLFGTYALYTYNIHCCYSWRLDDYIVCSRLMCVLRYCSVKSSQSLQCVFVYSLSGRLQIKVFGYRRTNTNNYIITVCIFSMFFFAFLNDFILVIMLCDRCNNNNYIHRSIINIIFNFFVSGKNTNDFKII